MLTSHSEAESLRTILENIQTPERLDSHPWVSRLFVQDAVERNGQLRTERPGQQLVAAVSELFSGTMPSTPPRRGKRLDNHWGEFGLLAARYFAPLQFGTPVPDSLRDAWGRIDTAILYSVYGKPAEALGEEQVRQYQLVGADLEYACASTLSDWHKKGLHRLAEFILNREGFLARSAPKPPEIPAQDPLAGTAARARTRRRLWLVLTLLLALAIGLGSRKAWRIYESGLPLYRDVTQLRELLHAPPGLGTLEAAVPVLGSLQADLAAFEEEARPLLWLSPKLGWLPVYGNDLAAAPALLETAGHLVDAALFSCQAAQPALDAFNAPGFSPDPASLTALLVQAQPRIGEARQALDKAIALRAGFKADGLSPRLRSLVVDELDPTLRLADESLSLGAALPAILGAADEGPKTYLLLAQNEDELRPTGGFITSVGNLVLHNGRVISLEFEDVGQNQEDWYQPYPAAPWQLQEYMNSRVLILRDANWFSDFPTTALWAEYLYAYRHSHSVDGVIAFDQHFLVMLLEQLGPLDVEGAPHPLRADNVIEYMRQAKSPPAGEELPADWTRKGFIGDIAASVLDAVQSGDQDWTAMAEVFSRALEQRHLLLQFDHPVVAALSAERGWDNAVRPGTGDFLMVTDTNIGFNKTNAVVDVRLTYDIDLTDPGSPVGTLTVTHQNRARGDVPCIHWDSGQISGEDNYPINRCYWNYLRVYKQAGVHLLDDATPHAIPGEWMILGRDVPARVDVLEEDGLRDVQGFGTLLVVPGGEALSTSFPFALPPGVLSTQADTGDLAFHLRVQKQPGTVQTPITIRIHFPKHALLKSVSRQATVQDGNLLLETDLRTDLELEIVFGVP